MVKNLHWDMVTDKGRKLLCMPFRLAAVFICVFLLSACSNSSTDDADSSVGALAFTLNAPSADAQTVPVSPEDFSCEKYGIVSVEAKVLDAQGDIVATAGPWDCATRQGSIPYLKAGENYTLNVTLSNGAGVVRYQGSRSGLKVRMGKVTNTDVNLELINFTPVFEEVASQQVQTGKNLNFSVSADDPDGGPVTYAAVELPTGASFDPDTGVFSWTPGEGTAGLYTIEFQALDEYAQAESLFVTILVTGVNLPPVFDPVAKKQVAEGKTVSFTLNAVDPEGDAVTYRAISLPTGASFNPSTRMFTWKPTYSQAGMYTVRFEATDGGTPPLSMLLDVTIVVTNTNRSPVVTAPTTVQRVSTSGTLQFMVSALDPDNDPVSISVADLPRDASGNYYTDVSFDPATGLFRWVTPGAGSVGVYKVLFLVEESGISVTPVYVTIQVDYDRSPPVLAPIGPKQVNPGEAIQFTVSATDPDYDGGGTLDLDYTVEPIEGQAYPEGSLFNPATRTFSWQPATHGNYWIRFRATDPLDDPDLLNSASEDVVITVGDAGANHPPVLEPIGDRVVWYGDTLTFTIYATDPDGDQLSYYAYGLPAGATFDAATRTFTWNTLCYLASPSIRCIHPVTKTVRFMVYDDGSPREFDYEDVEITLLFE